MKKFAYIIPFNSTVDDINNLRKVIQWVNGWNNIELIIVEYDGKSSKLDMVTEPFKHIFVKNGNMNFNKAWAYNIGIKRSESDIIICGDSSTVTNPENIQKGFEMLKDYDVIKPFSKVVEITIPQIKDFKVMDQTVNSPVIGEGDKDDRVNHLCNNITIFKRDTLLKIGGWEEKFLMECTEDFQSHKVKKLTKWIELEGKAYSFPYGKPHNDTIISNDINTNNNLKTLNVAQLSQYVSTTYQNVGVRSKYE